MQNCLENFTKQFLFKIYYEIKIDNKMLNEEYYLKDSIIGENKYIQGVFDLNKILQFAQEIPK